MEIETKYIIDEKFKIDKIFADDYVRSIADKDSEETVPMKSVYYDTEEGRLQKDGIAMRVRKEGEKLVATLKWNGKSKDGLYKREEINIPVSDENSLMNADIEIFEQSQMYQVLKDLTKGRKLVPIMDMEFDRRQIRLDTGNSISELSIDNGIINCGGKQAEIQEMEIELYSGDCDDMEAIGDKLAEKYSLQKGERSKFKQGLDLLK